MRCFAAHVIRKPGMQGLLAGELAIRGRRWWRDTDVEQPELANCQAIQ
jgi:hypothetical protein